MQKEMKLVTDIQKSKSDRIPVIRATLNVGFPYNLNSRRSQYEAQTLSRREDHFDPERTERKGVGDKCKSLSIVTDPLNSDPLNSPP